MFKNLKWVLCLCSKPVWRKRSGGHKRILHLLQHPQIPENPESKRVHTLAMRRSLVTSNTQFGLKQKVVFYIFYFF